jgi:hypothetical protein
MKSPVCQRSPRELEKTRTYPDHPDQASESLGFRPVSKVDPTRTLPGPPEEIMRKLRFRMAWMSPWLLEAGAVFLLIVVLGTIGGSR